jgi:long-chain acyl-CoA synthetase
MNLAELLAATAERLPDKAALVTASGDRTLNYKELEREVERVARGLRSHGLGLQTGDRVAVAMSNVPEFVISYFGILRAGLVMVPLNVMLTTSEMSKILGDSGAKVVLASPPFDVAVGQATGREGAEVISTEGWASFGASAPPMEHFRTSTDDLAVLAYTSGTTGEPKGAMLTHGNLKANLDQQMAIPDDQVTESDVLFLSLPMFHIFGLNVPLGLLVMNGATGLLVERFEPVEALRAIEQHRVTVLFGAPPMYIAWINTPGADQYDLSSVRLAISGAAPLSEGTLKGFEDMFGVAIHEGYGMTETAPTLTSNRMAERPRPGSVGRPLPGIDIRLIDEEGHDVELGDTGEIIVRGPNVFKGYWQRETETADCFTDGWFRTGDVAVEDEEGYLYLVDRKRDLIIVSGFNVFPSEVEAALLTNPKIVDAAVIGENHPYTGESVKAHVVLAEGEQATEEELLADIQIRLARFKCPNSIVITDDLPHLLTGKVLRRALRT